MKYLVRDKVLAIGDDYWIEDEEGRHAFLVDGKALRMRDTLELKDPDGHILITLREKWFSFRDAMTLERDGRRLAVIRRKRLSLLRNHYRVTLAEGTEVDVSGRILDREFKVEYDGELLALISRQWYRIRETYAVDVVREDADAALLIAVAVCVIRMAEKERDEDD
ncbi:MULTISPECIES: LURP-one-related/scramblase family protein [unclassified Streptomyces]|uniref:LURP-one-related/scramblase family protein n=1 Tax=unclassified Streptomyces TaxID=2593676 RepID=UPI00226DA2E3|nr:MULTISPECIES: LURP-one-related family protein [unclassified Streptomyces]MCY0919245.1 LURP-one-related family protein [Streptomyces sp. H27-G5]MCY0956954.1 LURP-one-related family protein [Streptomyces sp. H27-H5]